jgi:CheY-like chemotaxis protein
MAAPSGAGKTILLIEDDAAVRRVMTTALQREGYRVIAAANGREVTDRVQEGVTPDLILLDMMLPAEDGWRLLERRQREPALAKAPVVIVTGLVGTPEWAAEIGAVGYLQKPFDPNTLLAEVRRWCGPPQPGP